MTAKRDPRFLELDAMIAADEQLARWREEDRLRSELAQAEPSHAFKRGENTVRWRVRRLAYLGSKRELARGVGR